MLALQTLGRAAKEIRSSPGMPLIRPLRQLQTAWRSSRVMAWAVTSRTAAQHGWGGDGVGYATYERHAIKVISISGHVMTALASGMLKTMQAYHSQTSNLDKHWTSHDLGILEEEMQFNYFGRGEWLCYGAYLIHGYL